MHRRTTCALALLATAFVAVAWSVAPSGAATSRALLRPHALKLLINGKTWPITQFNGLDRYTPIPAGRLRVEARWTTDARGTGYYVVISTTEPVKRNFRTCFAGTSCLVRQSVSILPGQEMSWTVKIMTVKGQRLVGGFMVCLDGKT